MKSLPERTILTLHQCLSIGFALVLIAATHPLWISGSHSAFPKIPLFGFLTGLSSWWDTAVLSGLVIGLLTTVVAAAVAASKQRGNSNRARSLERLGLWVALICGVALIALNQHRLQAWLYQLLLFLVAWNLRDTKTRLQWLQCLVISIYAYSAVGKLDYEFLHTVGQDFIQAMAQPVGMDVSQWSRTDRVIVAGLMPVAELSLAACLLWIRSRRAASYVAAGVHLALVWILGYQLQHSWGVIIWNLQFAVQAIVLFGFAKASHLHLFSMDSKQYGCKATLLLAMIMPISERWGYWDHWPSWALYAPHTSRAKVWVAPGSLQRLPLEVRQLAKESPSDSHWGVEIPLDQWSLTAIKVPIYPQSRFQLGLARYLADQIAAEHGIHVEVWSTASRWDGQRMIQRLNGKQQVNDAAGNFWLNSRP